MEIKPVPRFYAEVISEVITEPHLWISVSSTTGTYANLKSNPNCKGILRLIFDDVFESETIPNGSSSSIDLKVINANQCIGLWDFVESRINQVEKILVHCDAGVSRAPAIAASLSKVYLGDDSQYFTCGKYLPNLEIYRRLLRVKNIPVDELQLEKYYKSLIKEPIVFN